jgi:uncharacterized membrane protein YbhN (UPF0104 family)
MSPTAKGWLKLLLNLAVIALVAAFVQRTAVAAWRDLRTGGWSPADLQWGFIALSAVSYSLGQLPSGIFWYRILHALGQRPRLGETLRAFYIGHLGKYVPGKAMVVVLRAGLIGGSRVSRPLAAISVFYETLTTMAVGAFLAGAILLVGFRDQRVLQLAALGLMLAAGIPTLPPLVRRLVAWLRIGQVNAETARRLEGAGFRMLAFGWSVVPLGWLLVGLSLWAVVRGSGYTSDDPLLVQIVVCVAAAAMAVVAGFASLVPGGLFVREAALLVLLTPTFGKPAALVAAVLARLIWLLSEVLVSVILYAVRPPRDDAGAPAPQLGASP